MEWIAANWVWILIAIAFVAMHVFGHGGHGGHGRHRGHETDEARSGRLPSERGEGDRVAGHRH